MPKKIIIWFRNDLRLNDHPAIAAAVREKAEIIPAFIWDPKSEGKWPPGAASRSCLHHSLASLARSLEKVGSKLILRKGDSHEELKKLVNETKADAVYWSRRYEPQIIKRDSKIKKQLRETGLEAQSFNASLLLEPWEGLNKQGKPYQVFTPYYRNALTLIDIPNAQKKAKRLAKAKALPSSLALSDLNLKPDIPWDDGFYEKQQAGEAAARGALQKFLDSSVAVYPKQRDLPYTAGTSRLSTHLHFGELSPQHTWQACQEAMTNTSKRGSISGTEAFMRQLVWREFAHHLLYHFPHTTNEPLRREFKKFPWLKSKKKLHAWQRGLSGYPIVDAGMRELWQTGWMHNRVRMIVASFLIKDLHIHWLEGARWFWDTLTDANLANNSMSWQWVAGCGADAAPFFRIFNPITQGEKFDPNGAYVKRFLPELKALPVKFIHKPWEAPEEILVEAKVKLGKTYPKPIVDHKTAREKSLEAYAIMKHHE